MSASKHSAELVIDHLMWIVPDLDQGVAELERLSGFTARAGGAHAGRGTRNALLSFEGGQYLEILAPDPAQAVENAQTAALRSLTAPRLSTFCCRGVPLPEVAQRAQAAGLQTSGPLDYERRRPDGVLLRWQLLFLEGHAFGPLLPFFIDWGDAPHPAAEAIEPLSLSALTAFSPQPDTLMALYAALALPVAVEPAAQPGLQAELQAGARTLRLK